MIETPIEILREELNRIVTHINDVKTQERIISATAIAGSEDAKVLLTHKTDEKKFLYNAVIISAYGAFEHYIESLLAGYIKEQSKLLLKFSQLDSKIQNSYVENWKLLHKNIQYRKYSALNEKDLVKNLYDVIYRGKGCVKAECFYKPNGNYKSTTIHEVFQSIGIEDENVKEYCKIPVEDALTLNFETIVSEVDDIVERRHVIAHTTGKSDDLLDSDMLQLYIDHMKMYAEALCDFLNDKLMEMFWSGIKEEHCIIQAENAMKGPRVLVFKNVSGVSFEKNQRVTICMPKGTYPRYKFVNIDEIRIEKNAGNKVKEVRRLIPKSTYFEVSMSFNDPTVIKQKVKVANKAF